MLVLKRFHGVKKTTKTVVVGDVMSYKNSNYEVLDVYQKNANGKFSVRVLDLNDMSYTYGNKDIFDHYLFLSDEDKMIYQLEQ